MSNQNYRNQERDKNNFTEATEFAKKCATKLKEKKGKELLHLGCGSGRDSLFLNKIGFNVTALDISDIGIQKLSETIASKQIKGIKALVKDLKNIDFEKNTFDIVFANLSLHYFNDTTTTKIFEKIHHCLKPGGIFFTKCKSTKDLLCPTDFTPGETVFIKGCDRNFFSKPYMEQKLKNFQQKDVQETSATHVNYKSRFIEAIATK